MDLDGDIRDTLEGIASLPQQKDRITQYLSLLESTLHSSSPESSLIAYGRHFITSSSAAIAVGRKALGAYAAALCGGSGLGDQYTHLLVDGVGKEDYERYGALGAVTFAGNAGRETRTHVLEGLELSSLRSGWHEEQTTVLRHLQAHLLQEEEEWLAAARALMTIPLEGSSRLVSDEEKLDTYMTIVRLLLECGESGLAQTYFSRASLLIHTTTDKTTQLTYKLSQAKLFDYSARFNEAAQRYHELSFDSTIDEGDRLHMLRAAAITSILAPSGPQRSRILATLNRDERTHTSLPPSISIMLRKMLLEYIVRPAELQDFSQMLESHQRATVEGGGTVLERAVREHNIGACAKVYDNISFEALGDILGQTADQAEVAARRMVEQGRLRGWIDQPLHLLYFEGKGHEEAAGEGEGTAGGLGVERVVKPVEPVGLTEKWDERIKHVSDQVESLAAAILAKGLV